MMQSFNLEHFSLSAQPICGKLPKSKKLRKNIECYLNTVVLSVQWQFIWSIRKPICTIFWKNELFRNECKETNK